ncbi:Sodium, potassium, lithium and rubidium/H(+) antiporter [Neobacillus rhizosphaerae]|uniref:Sodium, potassium, lithium and rubidium/H(+) antiporter n=1 Tax=Neobacillus rhizosphaerae TaxID=2880965 RepID=A0ABN8KR74_9BACI|nr:Na+/H+ antiporter [Neobacillus rhizosphaerae]CAH2715042.1 Sodium, potassium, lithium and rubidium/H(+) antiporter [Neobacillus rhizosphaerae]
MELFLIILLLLALIGLSNFVNHFTPFIPVPLIQIALGVLLASLPLGIQIPMEPELFFVLFIAPLLFHDGKNVSRQALWKLRKPILFLALGLVFVTVFAIGYLIHWLIPSIPLPASFALAAILSPTDVVAVGAISSRVKIPKTIMHILEGEGLMNDASGLVAFKFAVAATVTGVFSLAEASWSFLVISIGGLAGGAILAYLIIRLKIFIRRLGMEDVTIHMLIQLLTPFVIFYIVEHFHLSGILSVVAAGIVHAIYRDRDQAPAMQLRVVSQSTWTVLIYILNGLVFVLLGLQIPNVTNEIFKNPLFNNFEVSKYIVIITAALILLRFLWICASWWGGWQLKKQQFQKPSMKSICITTISGVRGAVTLAGAFTIPYVLADGSPFPERSLIIFIAAGVILVTLLVASLFLPILARSEKGKTEELREEMVRIATIRTIDAAISSIRELMNDDNRGAAVSVISTYNQIRNRLKNVSDEHWELQKLAETDIRMKALDEEAHNIERLKKEGQVDRETTYLMEEHIHRMRLAVTNRIQYRRLFFWTIFKRSVYKLFHLFVPKNQDRHKHHQVKTKKIIQLKVSMAKAAIRYLNDHMTPENEDIYLLLIGEYNEMVMKFKLAKKGADPIHYTHMQRELRIKAFQAERDEVQNLYEEGEITIEVIRKIRKQINIREAYWMEETSVHSH